MDFEQGTQLFTNIFFIGTLLFSLVVILKMLRKTKDKSMIWFLIQIICLTIGFYYFNQLVFIDRGIPAPMISEENTLMAYPLVISLILGQISMVIGIVKTRKVYQKDR